MSQDALQQDTLSPDAVDRIIAQWAVERPELETDGKHVTGRVIRLASIFQQHFSESYREAFEPHGLNETDFGVLSPLRRAGEPYELTPTELARHRMITSGGMTAAIDRLERKGLIERRPNPADRRGSLVRLTGEGKAVIDRAMELHAETELRLIAPLDEEDRRQLTRILRQLLRATDRAPAS
jgi:DNA-binding MarR family transcriptional regulator